MSPFASIHNLWKERNASIFNEKEKEELTLERNILGLSNVKGGEQARKRLWWWSSDDTVNQSLEEIKELLKAKSKYEEEENKYTVPVCMRILNEMKISFCRNEAYVDVMKSFEKKGWREIFFNMSDEQRKVWIDTVKKYHRDKDLLARRRRYETPLILEIEKIEQ